VKLSNVCLLHEHSVCEYSDGTRAPVEIVRRHARDAGINPIALNGDGVPCAGPLLSCQGIDLAIGVRTSATCAG